MYVSRYIANLLWQRTFFFVQREVQREATNNKNVAFDLSREL